MRHFRKDVCHLIHISGIMFSTILFSGRNLLFTAHGNIDCNTQVVFPNAHIELSDLFRDFDS